MKKNTIIAALLSLFVLVSVLSSCSDDDDNVPGAPEQNKNIQLKNDAKLGNILTDSAGNTLYFFTPDVTSPTKCVEGCLIVWPLFYKANPSLGTGLDQKDFGVADRPDGKKQTTYKGSPLYYYEPDQAPGDTKGEGLENAWFVAKPDYTIMIGHAQLIGEDNVSYTGNYQPGVAPFTPFFTTADGITLYTFTKDAPNKNNYTSETDQAKNAVWPIFAGSKTLVVPSVLNKADFTTITVFGNPQLVYKGAPLYTFGRDTGRGSTKGVSVPTPGIWPVATDPKIAFIPPTAP